MDLVLVASKDGRALSRVNRRSKDSAALLREADKAALVLVQPLLSERSGFVKVMANAEGGGITVDDVRVPQALGQVFSIAAGPHVLRVDKEGFYPTTVDVLVRPGRVSAVDVTLVPAAETVRSYNQQASLLRTTAWITAGIAIASAAASVVFYTQASDDLNTVERFALTNDEGRALSSRADAIEANDRFETNQALYLTFLGTAIASGTTSLGLFLFGPDPGRYSDFDALVREAKQ
ncbi:MAG: PEGA domain-containing protein [Myxococcales bacterium]|nr:PEGA domain-containing protein [Myxococcales bacterium]